MRVGAVIALAAGHAAHPSLVALAVLLGAHRLLAVAPTLVAGVSRGEVVALLQHQPVTGEDTGEAGGERREEGGGRGEGDAAYCFELVLDRGRGHDPGMERVRVLGCDLVPRFLYQRCVFGNVETLPALAPSLAVNVGSKTFAVPA